MKVLRLFLIMYVVGLNVSYAQLPHTFTQYTSEDGLSQKTVQSIIQDRKGLMWFATWDGLYKFDGYEFRNYKAHPGDKISLSNNRIDNIKEDPYGYIWVQSYDHLVFRFNPQTEKFQAIPYENYLAQDLYVFPSGDVWVTTAQKELIHITTNPDTHEMTARDFFKEHQVSYQEKVNRIYIDRSHNQWLLTDNGIYKLSCEGKGKRLFAYFVSPPKAGKRPFYAVLERGNTLYFTSAKGCVWEFTNEHFSLKELTTPSSVTFIHALKKEKLFIGTETDGFYIYNLTNNTFRHYNTTVCKDLKDNHIKEVYIDSYSHIWLRFNIPGVTHFNPETQQVDYFILQDKYGKNIVDSRPEMYVYEDVNGLLWLHPPGGGLAWYDRKNNKIHPFYNPSLQSGWSSDNKVTGLFTDRQGNLWLCSYGNGLEKITFNTSHFHLLTANSSDSEFPGNNSRAVYQDANGYIWVGNKDKIIRVYDKRMKYMGNLSANGRVIPGSGDELGIAYSFTQDHNGTIWIGTKGNGLIEARPGKETLTFQLKKYVADADDIYSLSGNSIYSLHEDAHHRLWIATFEGGINYLDLSVKALDFQFINYKNQLKNYPISQCYRTRFVTSGPQGDIWIGSTTGLLMCKGDFKEPEKIKFRHFTRIPSDAGSLSNNDVHSILFSRNKEMYVSTFGGGFNKLLSLDNKRARFKSYTMKDGLSSDILLSIKEDNKGNLWFATEEELCKFTPSNEKIENYPSKVFPMHISFNEGDAVCTQNGQLMFNTVKGVLFFSPDSISTNKYIPPIIFTHFQQAEQTITPDKGGILTTNIDDTKLIKLPYNRNSFSIQFAALDMRYPNSISYAYQLVGFEKNWNYIGNQRTATYTNLPKGTYLLKVKSTNSDGVWVDNIRTMTFVVLPSFWETPWAYFLYVLFIVLIIFIASYILFTIFRLKHKVNVEQQMTDIKLRFFTNISHELRTPLTLIAGPVEQILKNGHLKTEEKEQLALVERNTNRMLRLINQILDFRKIQNNKMRMRVQQIDVIPFVRHIMESFRYLADEYEIDFQLDTKLTSLTVWADADKLEKVLFNLLSNAFKYTPQGKQIKVAIAEGEKEISVAVEDQGIGIAENKQKSLFIRFESLLDKNLFNQSSTGIGLSLVKELVEMHHGSICFRSNPGEGSLFVVTFLKGKGHFEESTEYILSDRILTDPERALPPVQINSFMGNGKEEMDKEKETVLIVEDNQELRFFLKTIFIPYFNVIEAEDGKTGLKKSREYQPDMIISDVMMPEMDGIEMARSLRENITTSHIPIVLLTAKINIDSKIESMKLGVDDYITKPFSAAYLKARIFNLLEQRKKLQALYCASLLPVASEKQTIVSVETEKEETPFLSAGDRKFMDGVLETIEKNLDNGSLTVEEIAAEANMSRSVFFKKLKTLTGLSPIEFLKEIRMKRAAQLIETETYNMAQIAYMVGFNDSHYFSKCFKQHYGITPTEYKESRLQPFVKKL
ncbi:two-component regulator propeller domain-containing protein [uncultured Bacteroides sp.]|uniref:hybrid sensor histidine kinase/response regulator transcription factor n=1 Tax=uncultured Bacteroides sp. TaxID=162156 RepID=UPI00280A5813|nr:two-component regulator propeller domain-containing protein [uncultured Bacteroides sp.]